MPTGYEVKMYHDIGRAADALERIAESLDFLVNREHIGEVTVVQAPAVDPNAPHVKVKHGRCPTCGHYGEDCTGEERGAARSEPETVRDAAGRQVRSGRPY